MTGGVPSNARDFYEKLTADRDTALAAIRTLVSSTPLTFENEWRDFKGQPADGDDTKEKWSKLLTAFANTGGGVVVWGINCRKEDDIDAACGFRLVEAPGAFLSRLTELLPEATDPPIQGVEMEYYLDPSEGGRGFVVCFIPESQFKPHRAEFCKLQYYIRVGDRCEICPAPLLRSLFAAKGQARFELHYRSKVEAINSIHKQSELRLTFSLLNTGTASANEIVVRLRTKSECAPITTYWDVQHYRDGKLFEGKKPLHPGQQLSIFQICAGSAETMVPDQKGNVGVIRKSSGNVLVVLDLYARDVDALVASLFLTEEKLATEHFGWTGFSRVQQSNPL